MNLKKRLLKKKAVFALEAKKRDSGEHLGIHIYIIIYNYIYIYVYIPRPSDYVKFLPLAEKAEHSVVSNEKRPFR